MCFIMARAAAASEGGAVSLRTLHVGVNVCLHVIKKIRENLLNNTHRAVGLHFYVQSPYGLYLLVGIAIIFPVITHGSHI